MNIEKLLSEAINFMKDGEITKAQSFLNQILAKFPKNPDALSQAGIILIHEKKFKKGKNLIQSSLLIKPNQPEALLNLGIAFYQESKFDDAIKWFDNAIKFKPDYSEAFYTKALSYQNKNLKDEAITNFELAILHNPNYIDPIVTLGALYYDLNEFGKALNLFKKAEILRPNDIGYLRMIANLNQKNGNLDEAIKYFNRAINLQPEDSDLYNDRGIFYLENLMFDEALINLDQAIKLNSDDSNLFFNRAVVFLKLLLYAEAEADCKKALELNPESSKIYSHLGNINFQLNKFDAALSFYDKAISLNPEDHMALISKAIFLKKIKRLDLAKIVYLRLLDFSENTDVTNDASLFFLNQKFFSIGWDAYAGRINMPVPLWKSFLNLTNELSKYSLKWEGQLNCESLLIIGDQGIGDQIIYLSMLKELSTKVKKITVLINHKLVTLFERSFKNISFIPIINYYDLKIPSGNSNFEYFILAGDLGRFLRRSIQSFQNQPNSYLEADIDKTARFRSKFKSTKLVCGISWASQGGTDKGLMHMNEAHAAAKTVLLSDLMPIFSKADLTYVNLQYGDVKDEILHFKNNFGVEVLDSDNDNYNDLDGLASLIQSCDFVITTSNVTAHIAGALGKTTFVLVNPEMLWYWHNENVSSWYPSVNIFQKEENGDWKSAIAKMASKIFNYLKGHTNG